MGSFSSKGKDKAVQSASTPNNYYDAFGHVLFDTSGHNAAFYPNISGDTQRGLDQSRAGSADAIGALRGYVSQSPEQGIEAMFNNPYYGATKNYLTSALTRQREMDQKELDNQLNARGQLGGSYDALRRKNFDDNYLNQFNQAELQSRQASSDAYNTQYGNLLNALTGFQNYYGATQDQLYKPLTAAAALQGAVNPLQNQLASYYATKGQQSLQGGNGLGSIASVFGGGK